MGDITLDNNASDNKLILETPLQALASSLGGFPKSTQTSPPVPCYLTWSVSKTSLHFAQTNYNTVQHPKEGSNKQEYLCLDSLSKT